jgi:hypothetical protein
MRKWWMMPEDLKPVAEVREWRRKMEEGWKGKSKEEIRQELNKAAEDFRKELETEQQQNKTGTA